MNNSRWATTAYILVLISLGYFATDIYLPSLPALSDYFHASENEVQMTLFSYLLSFAFVPLIFGSLSDHIGRKKVILMGIAIGIAATFGCLFATSIDYLIAFRFVQGIGTGAVLISSRDHCFRLVYRQGIDKTNFLCDNVHAFSFGIGPHHRRGAPAGFNWQAAFIFLVCYMLFILLWVIARPETLKAPSHKKISEAFSNYGFHFKNRPFIYQIMLVFPTIGMYGYFATSPFLFQEIIGLSPLEYGSLSLYIGGTIMAMSLINTRLIHYLSMDAILYIGGTMMVLSGSLLLFFHLTGILTTWSLLGPAMIYFTCMPLCISNSASKAMGNVTTHFGSATAMLTTLQFLAGAVGTLIFSLIHDNSVLPLALCFLLMGVLCIIHTSLLGLVNK